MHRLTQAEQAQYATDGFLLVSDLIDPAAIAHYEDRFVELALGNTEAPAAMKLMRDIMVVKGAVDPKTALHGVNVPDIESPKRQLLNLALCLQYLASGRVRVHGGAGD